MERELARANAANNVMASKQRCWWMVSMSWLHTAQRPVSVSVSYRAVSLLVHGSRGDVWNSNLQD